MTNRDKMYESNSRARKWLVSKGYSDIHLFPHNRFSKDIHFQNLSFDGCATLKKKFVLFQIKTNCPPTRQVQEQMFLASKDSGVILLWISADKKHQLKVWGEPNYDNN